MADYKEIYTTQFDPRVYVSSFFGKESFEHQFTCLDYLHECFSKGKVKGDKMLDLGCGPSVNSIISASAVVQQITMSDYVDKNLQMVQHWIEKSTEALDYTPAFQHVAKLEGITDPTILEKRVRNSIKHLHHGDISLPNPLHPVKDKFDVVATVFVLENMENEDDFCKALRNVASLLRTGGFYICFSTLGATSFQVGTTTIPNLPLHQDLIFRGLKEAQLEKMDWKVYHYSKAVSFAENQFALCGLIAQKK